MNTPEFPTPWQKKTIWTALTALSMVGIGTISVGLIWIISNVIGFLQPILIPFAVAGVMAYLLDPVVNRLQRGGFNRLGAALFILATFVLAMALALLLLVPVLGHQFASFIEKFPQYAMRVQAVASDSGGSLFTRLFGPLLDSLGLQGTISMEDIRRSFGEAVTQALQWIAGFGRSLISGGAAVINGLALLVVTPIVAFYILLDWQPMVAAIDSWLPLQHRETIRGLAAEIDLALADRKSVV